MIRSSLILKRLALATFVVCLATVIAGEALAARHGVTVQVEQPSTSQTRATWRSAWAYFDGGTDYSSLPYNDAQLHAEGVVWQGTPGRVTWRIIFNGRATVRVGDRILFEGNSGGRLTRIDVPVAWDGDSLPLSFDYAPPPKPGAGEQRIEMGLYEPAPWGGWRLLPDYRLYSAPPSPESARFEVIRATVTAAGYAGLLLGLAALAAAFVWERKLAARRETWLFAGLFVLALTVRLIAIAERAAADTRLYLILPGNDNYVWWGREWVAGGRALAGGYWPPGAIAVMGWLMHLFGPHMLTVTAACAVFGAISVGLIAASGWIAFGPRAGLMGGLAAALYAPLVFFHGTPGLDNVFAFMVSVAALAGALLGRSPRWHYAALFGLAVGLTALARPTGLLLAPSILAGLALTRNPTAPWRGWKPAITLTAVAAAAVALTLAPLAVANRAAGTDFLISGNGPNTIYLGNNRDASGLNEDSQAFTLAGLRGMDRAEAALQDAMADPGRESALMLHKFGLYFANISQGNIYDYVRQGIRSSRLIGALSADGWIGMKALAGLATAGVALLLMDRERRSQDFPWMIVCLIVLMAMGTILFHVAERFRVDILPLLCIAAGPALDHLARVVAARRPQRVTAAAGGIALALMLAASLAEEYLPPKGYLTGDAPPAMTPISASFDGQVSLLGALPIESDHRPGGYAYVTLFWQSTAARKDYWVSIQLIDPAGRRIAGKDVILGSVTYPPVGAAHWPNGSRLAESYLVDIPGDAPAVMDVYALLYDPDTKKRLPIIGPDGAKSKAEWARVGRIGLVSGGKPLTQEKPIAPASYTLGGALKITGVDAPKTVTRTERLRVRIRLEAVAPVAQDYVAFVALLDARGRLVAQNDSVTLAGDWTTSALVPNTPLDMERELTLPPDLPPGDYRLVMGMYSYPLLERLPASDADGTLQADGLITLGEVTVQVDGPGGYAP